VADIDVDLVALGPALAECLTAPERIGLVRGADGVEKQVLRHLLRKAIPDATLTN